MNAQKTTNVGIIKKLGDLPPDTVISEEALAKIQELLRVALEYRRILYELAMLSGLPAANGNR